MTGKSFIGKYMANFVQFYNFWACYTSPLQFGERTSMPYSNNDLSLGNLKNQGSVRWPCCWKMQNWVNWSEKKNAWNVWFYNLLQRYNLVCVNNLLDFNTSRGSMPCFATHGRVCLLFETNELFISRSQGRHLSSKKCSPVFEPFAQWFLMSKWSKVFVTYSF